MLLSVTGVPGTGKTVVSQALARRLGFVYVSDSDIIDQFSLRESYDTFMHTYDISVSSFVAAVLTFCHGKDVVLDSHLSHYAPADFVVVCQCPLSLLRERLLHRGYSSVKIEENMECLRMQICYGETVERDLPHMVIDTSCSVDVNVYSIIETLKSFQAGV